MAIPDPEAQVQFLFKIQRLLSEGSFVTTYKFALLLSLADLAVERGNDEGDPLALDTTDLAERFVSLYWNQVLPWIPQNGDPRRLHQASGAEAAIIKAVAEAHERYRGSLPRLRQRRPDWLRLLRRVGSIIAIMPLWKLQTVRGQKLEFLYPNLGKGNRLNLTGEAIYCFRRFRDIIGDVAENAWMRFIRALPRNRPLLGEASDLRAFLFGPDRRSLCAFRQQLAEVQEGRCFYCASRLRSDGVVDHFIPWSRYPLDVGQNLVLTDDACNSGKSDNLAAFPHLQRWALRNSGKAYRDRLEGATLPSDPHSATRVAAWAYDQAERTGALVWSEGRGDLVALDRRWRNAPGISGLTH